MSRICDISGKRANNANRVTFSNKHNAYWQYPNLQTKKFFSAELDRYVKLKVRTAAAAAANAAAAAVAATAAAARERGTKRDV